MSVGGGCVWSFLLAVGWKALTQKLTIARERHRQGEQSESTVWVIADERQYPHPEWLKKNHRAMIGNGIPTSHASPYFMSRLLQVFR